jgi:SSS family solute:Na+ symporter
MIGQTVGTWEIVVILAYLLLVGYLGWLGYRRTQTATDYLVAGRKAHPFIMAMSYGATFISTSAIVGFGGVAGLFGMSLLWLTFLNIFVGIFIAFVVLGGPTRRLGHHLDAHTFPELLGRRYNSKFIQVFAGLIIFFFMPLYAAAVLMGGSEFIKAQFGIDFNTALLIFAVIVAAYVIAGGLKGVMYTDALQGSIMAVGMLILIIYGYTKVGGILAGHQALTDLADLVPGKLKDMGHRGWTVMPLFGWGDVKYDLWWTVVTTIVMGVGIGVLAQPQLAVRFMTVKSKRELNRAVATGGVFILLMTGVAFTVGSLSNAYFSQHGALMKGRVTKVINADKHHVVLQLMKEEGGKWADLEGKTAPAVLDKDKPYLESTFDVQGQTGRIAQGRSISVVYAKGSSDQIIPTYITSALPKWFGIVFLLTLLAAAMSTLSSQFHTLGTGIGRDVYEQISGSHGKTIGITRIGIIIGLILAVLFSTYARSDYIIARATSIFFGLCASAFLPTFVGGLFSRRVTKAAAIASMTVGFLVTVFWLVFVKAQEASAIGLVQKVTDGKTSILWNHPNWPVVDQLLIALPLSVLALIIVSAFTRPPDGAHLAKCFAGVPQAQRNP